MAKKEGGELAESLRCRTNYFSVVSSGTLWIRVQIEHSPVILSGYME